MYYINIILYIIYNEIFCIMSRSPYVKHLTRTLHFSYHGLEDRSSCNLPAEGDVMAWRCRNKGKLQRKAPSQ